MKKDTILQTRMGTCVLGQAKQIVRLGRTGSPLGAGWESAWGGLRTMLLLLILMLGVVTSWGQTGLSGYWYLQNHKDISHYLYPSGDKDGSDNPYVKTDKKQDGPAVWMLINSSGDEYFIRHYSDGRYIIADNNTVLEKTVALIEVDNLADYGDRALFVISETSTGSGIYNIKPKGANNDGGKNFLSPIGGVGKNIGLFSASDQLSQWKLTRVPAKPTLSRTDNKVSITTVFGDAYYKLDNKDISTDDATAPSVVGDGIDGTKGKTITLEYGPKYTVRTIAGYKNDKFDSNEWWTSEVTSSDYQIKLIAPNLSVTGNTVTISSSQGGTNYKFKYSYEDGVNLKTGGTTYSSPINLEAGSRYVVRAIAYNEVSGKTYYSDQETSVVVNLRGTVTLNSLADIDDATGNYVLSDNFEATGSPQNNIGSSSNPFKGTIDGEMKTISASGPLFECIENATIKNVILTGVNVSTSGNAGAIACEAKGASRIYNCGLLDGTVSGSEYTGGLIGLLDGSSRVINCYSYANITGGSSVGGIVGYNNVATTATNLKTMVMNCMFYGNIAVTDGTSIAPIYNGKEIVNRDANGVSNYNYFRLEAPYVKPTGVIYNGALGAEDRFLQRFEFYRHLLNSHRNLAAWWATNNYDDKDEMAKWVLEPSQLDGNTPYPILKAAKDQNGNVIQYPSVVNIDAKNATTQTERNKGGKLGELSVTIQMGSGGAVYGPPTGASITTSSLTLNITDKDPDHFNFNYYKVQLPYYNDVGTKNYNGNRVVTGWKIVDITVNGTKTSTGTGGWSTDENVTIDPETGEITSMPYNFADRGSTKKDLYSVTKRVFNQGAYWDVPEGVSAITIEPYWAKCAYLADAYADVVYNAAMTSATNVPNVGGGQKYTNGNSYPIAGESQKVFTSKGNAIATSNSGLFQGVTGTPKNQTVYDYAVVLVGNYHIYHSSSSKLDADMSKPYTVTSVDLDGDNEPDYSYILRFDGRQNVHPVRVDFINIPGFGMAQKSTGGTGSYNFGIMQPKGWFESTNTSLFRETQFEYDNKDRIAAPYILQGGVMEQWVSGQSGGAKNLTTYFHVGGNVWFKEFHRGCHQDSELQSAHPPVSVTGGDYDEFYLTGLYKALTTYDDNAECYINGGRFAMLAGTGMEGIGDADEHTNGNITWQIQNADIDEFYGGSINAASPMQGSITTVIEGGYIRQFCGGPKFGDMQDGRTVKTTATGCTFGTYFGAGYGGNSYSRQIPFNYSNNITNIEWNKWVKGEIRAENDANFNGYKQEYKKVTTGNRGIFEGVSTQFNYQFLPVSGNTTNVARLFIEYVKFSLATTHGITSTLKGCTINENFYGGGSLGKVAGDVTSTLDGCTVYGNVFGAGYSASLPKVMVDAIGFEIEPYYYTALGTYRTGVKYNVDDPKKDEDTGEDIYAPTEYTWVQGAPDSHVDINKTDHTLSTPENLDKSNLGSVSGNVTLTLKGNTIVGTLEGEGNSQTLKDGTGNVYGGGDQSYVYNEDDADQGKGSETKASTTVNLWGNTLVYGNVFGGGNNGKVSGNTTVNIGEAPSSTSSGSSSGDDPNP